jgi:hypothetical protein
MTLPFNLSSSFSSNILMIFLCEFNLIVLKMVIYAPLFSSLVKFYFS